ncbi:hypothetical protein THS27_07465 [Thalassospira sp. MCCC 1A01428]|nr:hypothetical protein THS27_07465 [Thalassospira sp. MCCC 1A01428]
MFFYLRHNTAHITVFARYLAFAGHNRLGNNNMPSRPPSPGINMQMSASITSALFGTRPVDLK